MASILTLPKIIRPRPKRHGRLNRAHRLADGVLGFWKAHHADAGGLLLRDLSGYGNHGTLTNMTPASDWVDTERGKALDFDGVNDHVVVAGVGAAMPTNSFTIFFVADYGGSNYRYVFGRNASNGLSFGVNNTGVLYSHNVLTGVTALSQTAPNYAAYTYDGTTGNYYLNGKLDKTGSVSTGASSTDAYISTYNGSNGAWDDKIYAVLVFDRALSPSEVQALYYESLQGYPELLVDDFPRRYIVPSAAGGPQTVNQDAPATATVAAYDATITTGAVSTSQDATAASTAASFDATITVGSVSTAQDAPASSTTAAYDATITVGSVSTTQDAAAALSVAAYDATVSIAAAGAQTASQDAAASLSASAYDSTITVGSVTTTQDAAAASSATAYDATITATITTTQDATVSLSASVFDATITVGSVTTTQDAPAALTAAAYSATVTGGTIIDTMTPTAAYAPTLTPMAPYAPTLNPKTR